MQGVRTHQTSDVLGSCLLNRELCSACFMGSRYEQLGIITIAQSTYFLCRICQDVCASLKATSRPVRFIPSHFPMHGYISFGCFSFFSRRTFRSRFLQRTNYKSFLGIESIHLRAWMPLNVRAFVAALENHYPVVPYIKKSGDPRLIGVLDAIVESYAGEKGFMCVSINLVTGSHLIFMLSSGVHIAVRCTCLRS